MGYNEARGVFEELVTDENRCWPTFLDFSYEERRAMQVVCVFCDIFQELLVFLRCRLSPRFRRPLVGAAFAVGWMSLALACCSLLMELAWSRRRSWGCEDAAPGLLRGLVVSACPMSVGCRLIPVLVSGRFVRRVRLEAFCAFGGLVPVSSAGDYSASVSDY